MGRRCNREKRECRGVQPFLPGFTDTEEEAGIEMALRVKQIEARRLAEGKPASPIKRTRKHKAEGEEWGLGRAGSRNVQPTGEQAAQVKRLRGLGIDAKLL